MRFLSIYGLAFCLTLGGCAINPVTGDADFVTVSESDEIKQGRAYHKQIVAQYGFYDDPDLQRYINRIGETLARKSHRSHLEFEFTVLDSPEINAFALPGGYIYITRGILAYLDSEAELAGVLGHEIGHVTARHSVRQQSGQFASDLFGVLVTAATGSQGLGGVSQQLGTGLIRGYGRDHELEADRLGAQYLHKTGYNPETMLEVIGVLKDQEVYEKALAKKEGREPSIYHGVFSSHPRNDDRLKTVVREARKLSDKKYRSNNRPAYHAEIDGIVWGPSPAHGVVVDNRFAHPGLAFALQFPENWKVRNSTQTLQATDPGSTALIQVSLDKRNKKESPDAILERLTGNKKLKIQKQDHGVSAKIDVKLEDGSSQPARISAIPLDGAEVLILLGTSPKKQFSATDKKLLAVNRGFTRLTQAQVDAIRAPRLRIVDRKSQSFRSLAKNSAIEYEAESMLRLLNRAFPKGDISTIRQIKTVIFDD